MLRLLLIALIMLVLTLPAQAESRYTTSNNQSISVDGRLDLEVVIPRLLYLRVGTGTTLGNSATVNLIDFTVPAAQVGSGTPVSATAGSGDLGGGVVTARLLGNDGTISLSSTTIGPLSSGTGTTVSYTQLETAATTLTTASILPAPALADGATTAVSVPAGTGRLVNRDARWTYTYTNAQVAAAGVYGGVNVNNGRVVYTASMP